MARSETKAYSLRPGRHGRYLCTPPAANSTFMQLLGRSLECLVNSILRNCPILSIASYHYETYIDGSEVAVCLTTVDSFWPAFYFVGSISIFFLLPFLILLVLYSIIAKHLMNNPGLISHGNRNNVLKYRKQVIFMLGAVVLSFFVCLLPFRALTLWIIVVPSETIMALGIEGYYNLLYFCRIMLYLNSAMNPILYNLMSSKFRDGFLRLLGCSSMVKNKIKVGDRKGTFHTTSTNLSSSSQSSRLRNSLKQKEESIMADSQDKLFRDDSTSSDEERKDSIWNPNSSLVKRIANNFEDIQEIEEIDDTDSSRSCNNMNYDINGVVKVCIAPYIIHKTISEHCGRTERPQPLQKNGKTSFIQSKQTSKKISNKCSQDESSCYEQEILVKRTLLNSQTSKESIV